MKILYKLIINISIAFTLCVILLIIFSPYGYHKEFDKKLLIAQIEIDASSLDVFNYLGDSDNAKDWSVFVDHIITLNNDEIEDGNVGSIRRCFKNSDRKGLQWDEEIIEVIPNQKRTLTIFNMFEFPVSAENLATDQLYKSISDNKTNLSFTVFFRNNKPGWMDAFKMYIAAYKIKSVLKKNLENIKFQTERT